METPDQPDTPELKETSLVPEPLPALPVRPSRPPAKPTSYWVKKLLVCNPFYLVSAALLLYGFYLVSTDNNFPGKEIAQLAFNFGSMQFYEILLVGTAILLARRRIWYDSNLLIFLENLLILVPFILVSQAALIGQTAVRVLCLVGGAMACVRFAGLKRFHRPLNLPRGLLNCGALLLVVNVVLPLIFRHLNDSKVGTKPTVGDAYVMNQFCWLLILPCLIALANLLPRPKQEGDLLPQRRWVPTGILTLWLAGTAVHLYCLGFVFNFDFENYFVVPPLWALAWTVYFRHGDWVPFRALRPALLISPAVITLIAVSHSAFNIFVALTGLNVLAYALIFLRDGNNRMVAHLLKISLAALALGFIKNLEPHLPVYLNAGDGTHVFVIAYLGYWVVVSRQPKLGIIGALLVGFACGQQFQPYFYGPHFGIQCALLFWMLHSLLWKDEEHPGAQTARDFACSLWVAHCFVVLVSGWDHAHEMIYLGAVLLVAAWMVATFVYHHRAPFILLIAAAVAVLLQPTAFTVTKAQSTPTGLLVVAGSFLLFALGTLAALTKSKWHPAPAIAPVRNQTKTNL